MNIAYLQFVIDTISNYAIYCTLLSIWPCFCKHFLLLHFPIDNFSEKVDNNSNLFSIRSSYVPVILWTKGS